MQAPSFLPLFFTIVLAAGIASCKGPEGPQGPAGAQGAAGAPGAQGAKGDQGNANVVTTGWETLDWQRSNEIFLESNGEIYFFEGTKNNENPIFTQEAIDKAAIFTYIKHIEFNYNFQTERYELKERITSQNKAGSFFKIPGRASNNLTYRDVSYANVEVHGVGVNHFSAGIFLRVRDDFTPPYTNILPELAGKSISFYKDLIKDIQFRHVIVYGNPSGRMADINWDNYDEVKEALGLED